MSIKKIQIKSPCHNMLVSHYQIKLTLAFNCILSIKLGAHMCAFETLTNFKITQKVLFENLLF